MCYYYEVKMKIMIASKKGIDELVDETLKDIPVNKRLNKAVKGMYFDRKKGRLSWEMASHEIRVLNPFQSYVKPMKVIGDVKNKRIDIVGLCEDMPNYLIASNEDEVKLFNKEVFSAGWLSCQNQLYVWDNGIFLRNLKQSYLPKKLIITNIEGVYLAEGYCVHENKEKRPLKNTELGYGAYNEKADGSKYRYGMGSPNIWECVIDQMIGYFLNTDFYCASDYKVIYGSERARDKLVEVFEKLGIPKLS